MVKRLFSIISGASTLWGFLPGTVTAAISGFLWVIAMAAVGYMQDVQIFWIMFGLPVAGAAIITGILKFSEWKDQITASDKIEVTNFLLGSDYTLNQSGNPTNIKGMQVVAVLVSTASFPLSLIIEEVRSSVDGRWAPNKPIKNPQVIIPKRSSRNYKDYSIDMNDVPIFQRGTGSFQFRCRYGYEGREKFVLNKAVEFGVAYEPALRRHIIFDIKDA